MRLKYEHVELKRDTWFQPSVFVENYEDAVNAVREMIADIDREMLVQLNLTNSGRVINASVCSVGTASQAQFSMVEILRNLILSGGNRIILLHNHPSGSADPSKEDLEVTKEFSKICRMMGIHFLDHIIVGEENCVCSLSQEYNEYFLGD